MQSSATEPINVEQEIERLIAALHSVFHSGVYLSDRDHRIETCAQLSRLKYLAKRADNELLYAFCEQFEDVLFLILKKEGKTYDPVLNWHELLKQQLYDLFAQYQNGKVTSHNDLNFSLANKPDLQFPDRRAMLENLKDAAILYVENDTGMRRDIAHFLNRRVGRLYEADDAETALEIYQTQRPDIIMTALNLPGIGGIEMIREIRKNNAYIPIIVITAFTDQDFYLETDRLGVNAYILKPFKVRELEYEMIKLIEMIR